MAIWVAVGATLAALFLVARCLCRRIDDLQARVNRLECTTGGLQDATEFHNERINNDSNREQNAAFLHDRRAETESCLSTARPPPAGPSGT